MPSSYLFSSILTIIYFDISNKNSLGLSCTCKLLTCRPFESSISAPASKWFLLREVGMGRGKKSDRYLASGTAACSQMPFSPLSCYTLCKLRDSQSLQIHLTNCYNVFYAYIGVHVYRHTLTETYNTLGVLSIDVPTLRRDFADSPQIK